jgi:NADH-quinone oxidoreductase subunit N
MPASFIPSAADLLRFAPETLLTFVGVILMVLEPFTPAERKRPLAFVTLFSLIAALGLCFAGEPGTAFSDMIIIDGFSTYFRVLVLAVGILTVLCSMNYLKIAGHESGEYWALVVWSVVGQCLMASANELVLLFIGLECSSIATYILAGYLRDDKRNNEAALKYFLLGSFATAFLLYGVAWIYGITGSTNLAVIRQTLLDPAKAPDQVLMTVAIAFMFVGLAFKVSAAPFQMWAPDVYQGAPAPVTAFMSAGPKAAAFAMFLRVFLTAFSPLEKNWEPIVWVSALATMIVGNFAALRQNNVKRMLAYSSIAHAGYIMVAVTTHSEVGTAAAMFYLAAYAFMNIGAFAVVTHIARKDERYVEIEDMAGLGLRQPVTAGLLTLFLLSLIGIPLTGGFFGKFYIFKAALDANFVWLTVLGLLNSAVAAYYYLRVIVVMYMKEPTKTTENLPPLSAGLRIAIWGSALATLFLGVFPSTVLDAAGLAARLVK